jgi:transcriptional regulator of PTS gene
VLTNLVPATVSNLVNDLIAGDLLHETGLQPRPAGSRGPRETRVDLNTGGVGAISVALGIYTRSVGIVDPRGGAVASTGIQPIPDHTSASETIDWVVETVERLLAESNLRRSAILGIGVSVEGDVDSEAGVSTHIPYRGWHDVPVARALGDRLGFPVVMANSTHAVATGELIFGRGGEGANLLFVNVFTTLGCVAIAGHRVLSTVGKTAGDIGHITVMRENGELCVCGKQGCLETIAGEYAVVSAGRAAAWSGRSPHLLALCRNQPHTITVYTVAQAAVDGDPVAVNIVERAASALAQVLAPLMGVLSPDEVVFDGVLPVLAGHVFFAPLNTALRTLLPIDRPIPALSIPSVLEGAFPADVARPSMIGAAALAYERFFFSPRKEEETIRQDEHERTKTTPENGTDSGVTGCAAQR